MNELITISGLEKNNYLLIDIMLWFLKVIYTIEVYISINISYEISLMIKSN